MALALCQYCPGHGYGNIDGTLKLKIVSFNVVNFYVLPKRVDPAESNLLQTKQAELRACICEIFQFPPQLTRGN